MDPNHDMMNDMYRLEKDNNHMLHAMRRRALISGLLKFIFWAALIIAPVWFYMTYLNSSVQKVISTANQIQATGQQAQAQLSSFQTLLRDLESKIPGLSHATSTK